MVIGVKHSPSIGQFFIAAQPARTSRALKWCEADKLVFLRIQEPDDGLQISIQIYEVHCSLSSYHVTPYEDRTVRAWLFCCGSRPAGHVGLIGRAALRPGSKAEWSEQV
ncbi:hypothetical protein HPP92_028983 [Vanilla planifolia]|uniref:Uncharacterized protein n=1 Tax=Vanilla planifolia TaxID=51239 RepID=A0A835P3Y1_VANPL|nr:hypothetical protein HPP92_028983 [Vanilla planifolia]KAG0446151.1 hypothetical protein HPP92_028972 [Vanilla planifolia]